MIPLGLLLMMDILLLLYVWYEEYYSKLLYIKKHLLVSIPQHSCLEPRKSTAVQRKSSNIGLLAIDLATRTRKCIQQKHGTNHSTSSIHPVNKKKLLDITRQYVWNELPLQFFSEPSTEQNRPVVFVCIEEIESLTNNSLRFAQLGGNIHRLFDQVSWRTEVYLVSSKDGSEHNHSLQWISPIVAWSCWTTWQ